MQFMDNVAYFSEHMAEIADMGVDILGSCCGTTPEYTRELKETVSWEVSFEEREKLKKKNRGVIVVTEEEKGEVKKEETKKTFFEKLQEGKKVIAVELDPPYDADCSKVLACGKALKNCGVDIITMADSPMGRSRVDSVLMSIKMAQEAGIDVMPHVCCRDKNMIAMRSGLIGAYINGIRNLLIVTGDPVPGTERNTITGVFDYNSIRLMRRVREMNREHFKEEPFFYGGALNYGRGKLDRIAERMEQKTEAGASYFLTQPVFSAEDMERIGWLKERVNTKILCGIMPLVSYKNAKFIQNEMTGICVPDEVVNRYHPEMSREEGEDVAVSLVEELTGQMKDLADGFYFMLPFNRVSIMEKYRKRAGK
jgi:homocysteine S-methyltransferase